MGRREEHRNTTGVSPMVGTFSSHPNAFSFESADMGPYLLPSKGS